MNKDTLVFDIETDSLDVSAAVPKWFGAYSYLTEKYIMVNCSDKSAVKQLLQEHKYLIGFNIKGFDIPILKNYLEETVFDYKIILDLYECLAPKGSNYGKFNKGRLAQMGYKLDNHKLKTIVEALGLDSENKGNIDYNLFKKESWSEEETAEIKKYLTKDVEITKKLFEWYSAQFEPLTKFLSEEDVRRLKHLRTSMSSLAYQIICNKAGLPFEWNDEVPENMQSFSGGHHIEFRNDLTRGNIVELDFTSAYPHALIMGNLFSPVINGWKGSDYFNLQGTYNDKQQGKIESALNEIFLERLKAKKSGDKAKNQAFKLIINSIYGLTGNYRFKSLYNPITAADCTCIVRTWLKKLAKLLEENGFTCLYGFTDSIYVLVPEGSNKEELMFVVGSFISEVKSKMPFPLDTFGLGVQEELKMIWFISKNCYLHVGIDNEVKYKSTLLNKNTPQIVLKVFEEYMKPKIVSELDVNFTLSELEEQIKLALKDSPELSAELHKVGEVSEYKVQTSLQYQISERYGSGDHLLIPNTVGVGVGRDLRYCTLQEFKENKLCVEDINLKKVLLWLKPFVRNKGLI